MPCIIDSVAHHFTGKQILGTMLDHWARNPDEPVILLSTRTGSEWKVNALRVALSKERKAQGVASYYGLDISEPFPYSHRTGYKGEAIVIRWHQTRSQKLRHVMDTKLFTGIMENH